MSWLKDRAERRQANADANEAERLARQRAQDAEELAQRQAALNAQVSSLERLLETARTFRGATLADLDERPPIVLKKGEAIYLVATGVILVEPRSAGGSWQSGSRGVSVKIPGTRSMRYRIGHTQGRYVAAPQVQTPIDTGTAVVTNQRVAFTGEKSIREWLWSKCIAVEHHDDAPFSVIAVSNRQKASGIGYTNDQATLIRFRLDLALAVASDTIDDMVHDLENDLRELTAPPVRPVHPQLPRPLPPPRG